ncbi:hypothetical protein RUM44_010944 [Polyplax serrata]|uniref:Tetratricopeptide SHNi-TPR domain-containing protein n=1 Tax=Polyplax serrata TaxID=468196 RepID=A0ABR1ANL6_POLSC
MADNSKANEPEQVLVEPAQTSESNKDTEGANIQNDEVNEKEKLKKEATMLFLQGKRSIYIKDFQAAVAALSEACQLFTQIYPEQDDGLADPYFYYGKALLEIGRNETDVLGDQMQEGADADDDDDEDENDEEEGGETTDQPEGEVKTNGNSTEEHELAKNGVNGDDNMEGKTSEESKTNEEGESDDINDLQLSWEYLELAKLIYMRKADTCKETAIKLAETYLCLGENGLESENYSIAVEDIKQALELQKVHLLEYDRRIAETYYQLGVAYSLAQNYDEAVNNFKKAIEQLNKKIASLETRQKNGESKTEEEEKDAFYTMDGEIKEIQSVIKDIEEKIRDMIESKNQVKAELIKKVVSGENQPGSSTSSGGAPAGSSASSSSSSANIPATDISHLIKKKRKNDEEGETVEKKSKLEN